MQIPPNIPLYHLNLLIFFFSIFSLQTLYASSLLTIDERPIHNGLMRFRDFELNYKLFAPPKLKNQIKFCDKTRTLVVVKSAAKNFERRELIRQTWANGTTLPSNYIVHFIIGSQINSSLESKLVEENERHNDLIRYDLMDSYRNLTLKMYAMFEWQQLMCPQAKYLVQIDDDVAIDLKRLDYFTYKEFDPIVQHQNGSAFFCFRNFISKPNRDPLNKHYVSPVSYAPHYYPPYCSGATMVLSTGAISRILPTVRKNNYISPDDAFYAGIIREQLGIGLHDQGLFCLFFTKKKRDKCRDGPGSMPRILTECQLSLKNMRRVYQKLISMTCQMKLGHHPTTKWNETQPKKLDLVFEEKISMVQCEKGEKGDFLFFNLSIVCQLVVMFLFILIVF